MMFQPQKSIRTIVAVAVPLLLLLFSACRTAEGVGSPKADWVAKNTCAAPCWGNITPGSTTSDEALKRLKENPLIDVSSISSSDFGGVTLVTWKFAQDPDNWQGQLTFDTGESSKAVTAVALITPNLCLREIVDAYGNPDTLFSALFKIDGSVALIWKTHGLLYLSKVTQPGSTIDGNVCGGRIILFPLETPLSQIPGIGHYMPQENQFSAWKGYGSY